MAIIEKNLIKEKCDLNIKKYLEGVDLQQEKKVGNNYIFAGVVKSLIERETKENEVYAAIELDCNNEIVNLTLWSDVYKEKIGEITEGNIIIFHGSVKEDTYRNCNTIQSNGRPEMYIF